MRGSFCPRHWAGHYESDKFVRAIFHDETGRLRNWSGAEPSNRGSARRIFDLGESSWARLRSALALAEIRMWEGPLCPDFFSEQIAALRPLPHSSRNRDSGIPQAKLFRADCFFNANFKHVVTSELGLCSDQWHGHCNSFATTRQNLNPTEMRTASHRSEERRVGKE